MTLILSGLIIALSIATGDATVIFVCTLLGAILVARWCGL
jgi:hypothetical protein